MGRSPLRFSGLHFSDLCFMEGRRRGREGKWCTYIDLCAIEAVLVDNTVKPEKKRELEQDCPRMT